MIRRPKIDLSLVLLLVLVGLLAGTSVFVYLNLRTDTVSSMVDNGETIRVLLVTEEDGSPISTQALIYNPRTNRVGLFDVPHDLGAILESLNRVDSISTLYEEGDIAAYRDEIADLLGVPIPFYLALDTEGLSDVVDLAEGLELFIAETYQMADPVDAGTLSGGESTGGPSTGGREHWGPRARQHWGAERWRRCRTRARGFTGAPACPPVHPPRPPCCFPRGTSPSTGRRYSCT